MIKEKKKRTIMRKRRTSDTNRILESENNNHRIK